MKPTCHQVRVAAAYLSAASVMLGLPAVVRANPTEKGNNAAVQQPLCDGCHTCPAPKPEGQCLKACPRLFAAHSRSDHGITEAPDVLWLSKIADQYGGVEFNHKLHASMSEMGQGCSACHHFCPPGKIPACVSCHAGDVKSTDLRQPGLKGAYHRQCLQCHREWSHETDCNVCHLQTFKGLPTSTTEKSGTAAPAADSTDIMGRSHPVLTVPERRVYVTPYQQGPLVTFYHKQHIDLFGLKCVSCHQKENCSYCHDIKRPAAKKKTMEQVHVICTNCHQADNCAKCHDTKERLGFSHVTTGWPLNRYHVGFDCRACHPTGKPIRKLDRDCTTCHAGWKQGHFRHAVTGVQLDETHAGLECTDCHIKLRFSKAATCTGCHDDGRDFRKTPPGTFVNGKDM